MGAYFLVMTLLGFTALFAQFGLGQTVVRLLPAAIARDNYGQVPVIVGNALFLNLVFTGVTALVFYGGAAEVVAVYVFHSERVAKVLGITVLVLVVSNLQAIQAEIFRGLHRIGLFSLFGGALYSFAFASSLLAVWEVSSRLDLTLVFWLMLSVYGSILLISSLFVLRAVPRGRERFATANPTLLKIATPLFLTGLATFVVNQADIWIVGSFLPDKDVALYGIASRFAMLLVMPLLIANMVLAPVISHLDSKDRRGQIERLLRSVAYLAFVPALLLFSLFLIGGAPLLKFLYGPFYETSHTTLVILGLGQLINVWTGSCGTVLAMTGHERSLMKIILVSSLIPVTLSLMAVGRFGINGVASAFAFGTAVQYLVLWGLTKRLTGIWTHSVSFIGPQALLRIFLPRSK